MRRSKMLLIFQDIIQHRFGFEDAPIFLADALLTAVEQAGMLPPHSTTTIPIEFKSGEKTTMIRNGNFWEPEHE